ELIGARNPIPGVEQVAVAGHLLDRVLQAAAIAAGHLSDLAGEVGLSLRQHVLQERGTGRDEPFELLRVGDLLPGLAQPFVAFRSGFDAERVAENETDQRTHDDLLVSVVSALCPAAARRMRAAATTACP